MTNAEPTLSSMKLPCPAGGAPDEAFTRSVLAELLDTCQCALQSSFEGKNGLVGAGKLQ